jgi:hypothetical protein
MNWSNHQRPYEVQYHELCAWCGGHTKAGKRNLDNLGYVTSYGVLKNDPGILH